MASYGISCGRYAGSKRSVRRQVRADGWVIEHDSEQTFCRSHQQDAGPNSRWLADAL